MKRFVIITALILSFTACKSDPDIEPTPDPGKTLTMTGEIAMTGSSYPKTYGLTDMEKNYVRLLDVLIFEYPSGRFLYSAPVQVQDDYYSSPTGNIKSIKFNMLYLENIWNATAVFVANARSQIADIKEGEMMNDALQKIIYTIPGDRKWRAQNSLNFDPIPMTSGPIYISHNQHGNVGQIQLHRSLASVTVNWNLQYLYPEELHLFNVNARGYVVTSSEWGGSEQGEVEVPPGNIRHRGPISYYYTDKDSNGNPITSEDVYIAEVSRGSADTPETNFALVLGARFSREGNKQEWSDEYKRMVYVPDMTVPVTYYKLEVVNRWPEDIYDEDWNWVETIWHFDNYIPILRNRMYNFLINYARVPGYATVEEAFAGPAFNTGDRAHDFDVEVYVDSESGTFITDGENFLALHEEETNIELPFEGGKATISTIFTNHPDGWRVRPVDDSEQWIKIIGDDRGNAHERKIVTIELPPSDTVRVGYLYVSAGHLYYTIKVGQGTSAILEFEDIIVPEDYLENGNPELVFYTQPLSMNAFDWYSFANVPNTYNTLDVPPAGLQHYPPLPTSCSALERHGYQNWRLPTTKEIYAFTDYCMSKYLEPEYTQARKQELFQFAQNNTYMSGDSNVANELHVYQINSRYDQNNFPLGTTRTRTSITKVTNNLSQIRCIRTVDEGMFLKTGTHMIMESGADTYTIVAYLLDGHGTLDITPGDSNYPDIVASVTGPTVETASNGYKKYTFELTTKDYLIMGAPARTSYFTLGSTDGQFQEMILLTQNSPYGYLLPAARTGLGYDMWVAEEDQRWNLSWYHYANTPDAYNTAFLPPLGSQVTTDTGFNGSRPFSCAALGAKSGGHTDWRMPNEIEMKAVNQFFREESVDLTDISVFGFVSNGTYVTGEVYPTNLAIAKAITMQNNNLSSASKNAAYSGQRVRCVRADSDFYCFDIANSMDFTVASQTKTFYISSTVGLSQTVTKDAKFDVYVKSLSISATPAYTIGGRGYYPVTITTNEAMTAEDDYFTITFHSSTNQHSFDVTVNMRGWLMAIPASESDLTYDIMMMNEELQPTVSDANVSNWYRRANVTVNYNSAEVPPGQGPQVTNSTGPGGAYPTSCRALRWGGYNDWRLPTVNEMLAINKHYSEKTDAGNLAEFGFASLNLASAESYDLNNGQGYVYYRILNMLTKNAAENNVTYTYKTSFAYARCVRTGSSGKDFFEEARSTIQNNGFPETHVISILSRTPINTTVGAESANFTTVVSSATITGGSLLPNGLYHYRLTVNVNYLNNGTRTATAKITASDNRVQYVDIVQTMRYRYANLIIAPEDQLGYITETNTYHNWYHIANVTQGVEQLNVPPAGNQLNPPYAYSCAARTDLGGGWRLPTAAEVVNIYNAIIASGQIPPQFLGLNTVSCSWMTATPGWVTNSNGVTTQYAQQFQVVAYNQNGNPVITNTGRAAKSTNVNSYVKRCVRNP